MDKDKKKEEKIKRAVKKQLDLLANDIVYVIDSNEKKWTTSLYHTKRYFEENGIKYITQKLETGDYSFIYQGEDFTDKFSIDRKQDINEFIGNFFEYQIDSNGNYKRNDKGSKIKSERFKRELERAEQFEYFSFAIEKGRLVDIYRQGFRSKAHINSVIGMFETIKNKYQIDFVEGMNFGEYLFYKSKYWLRSKLIVEFMNE